MQHIAFLGLGRMGAAVASRLLASGYRVTVHNRTPERAAPLVAAGAASAPTPRAACAGADAVISLTADDVSSPAMWLGADGALAADLPPHTLALECSTVSYAWALELGRRAAERGWRYLDSPVTGLPAAAAAGELTLLVGASAADLEAARPLLAAIATSVLHFGPVGAGTAYKLAVNLIGAVQIASAAEGLALAERAGIDPAVFADAIATGQAASPQVVRNTRRMVEGEFTRDVPFTPVLRLKDIDYALRLASEIGIATPFGAAARSAFARLVALGAVADHESRIIEVAREPS
jgi:3-hydroxyisobutyrate dehydrogenase